MVLTPLSIPLHTGMGIEHTALNHWMYHVGCTLACGTRVKYHHYSTGTYQEGEAVIVNTGSA